MTSLESLLSKGRAYGNSDDAEGIKLRSEDIPLKAKKKCKKGLCRAPPARCKGCATKGSKPLSLRKADANASAFLLREVLIGINNKSRSVYTNA